MKVSGFTFVRNAVKFDYPVVESITSILPLCHEVVVAVGNSEDGTRELVASIPSSKIRILDTVWDDSLREGGQVLALETDKAFGGISPESDWAFYIQADEVLHEKYHENILETMERRKNDPRVEGLLFDYLHFWGSYDFVGDSRKWYRREIRIIRNDRYIHSFLDAQGFRKGGKKLQVVPSGGVIHHYGWVKPPVKQQAKQQSFHRYWHDDRWIEKKVEKSEGYDYSDAGFLIPFTGTHPSPMQERISRRDWDFTYDPERNSPPLLPRMLHFVEKSTGWRIGEYKNYRLI